MRYAGATVALEAFSAKSHSKFFRDFILFQTALISVGRFSGTPTTGLPSAGRVPIRPERMCLIYRVLQKCRGFGDASRRDAVSWWNAAESIPGKVESLFCPRRQLRAVYALARDVVAREGAPAGFCGVSFLR
jgi:hypothetical protein